MTATDELRRMLDERGVEWTQGMAWNVTVINGDWLVVEDVDFGTLSVSTTAYQLTPEQAIAATLGSGTCEVVAQTWEDRGGDEEDTYKYELSCGHTVRMLDCEPLHNCPRCGKAVKR